MFFVGFVPEFAAFSLVASGYAVFLLLTLRTNRKARLRQLLFGALLFALLTAVSSLPTLEYLGYSAGLVPQGGNNARVLATMLVPNFFGAFRSETFWESEPTTSYFYGGLILPLLIPLGLFASGGRLAFFKGLFGVSLLLAMSPFSELMIAPLQSVPGIGALFRPMNFFTYFSISSVVLAVLGFERLQNNVYLKRATLVALAASIGLYAMPAARNRSIVSALLLTSVLLLGVYVVAATASRWKVWFVVVCLSELLFINSRLFFYKAADGLNLLSPTDYSQTDRELLSRLKADRDLFRISVNLEAGGGQWTSGPHVWRLESINGFDPLVNRFYVDYLRQSGCVISSNSRTFHLTNWKSDAWKFLNIKYYVDSRSPSPPPSSNFQLIYAGPLYKLYAYKSFTQRYLLLPPNEWKLDGSEARVSADSLTSALPVTVTNYTTQGKLMRVSSLSEGSLLFLSEIYYPGWRVRIDGIETGTLRVNDLFVGAVIPRGEHIVELTFRSRSFRYGVLVSSLALALMAGTMAGALLRLRGRMSRQSPGLPQTG
jgi:uncharacterized membrane protein YfhO